MTVTAQSIVKEVQRAVNDFPGDRVPASAVVDLLNQAQRLIQNVRPDSTSAVAPFTLTAGAKQALPVNASSLIDIQANTAGSQRPITKTDIELLDACEPGWRRKPRGSVVIHFMHDMRTPRVFWVYPPVNEGVQVELEASSYPIDVPPPSGNGKGWETVAGQISLTDEFEHALITLTLHLVYRSDLEGVQNNALADGYLQKASALLGAQLTTATAAAAKT